MLYEQRISVSYRLHGEGGVRRCTHNRIKIACQKTFCFMTGSYYSKSEHNEDHCLIQTFSMCCFQNKTVPVNWLNLQTYLHDALRWDTEHFPKSTVCELICPNTCIWLWIKSKREKMISNISYISFYFGTGR